VLSGEDISTSCQFGIIILLPQIVFDGLNNSFAFHWKCQAAVAPANDPKRLVRVNGVLFCDQEKMGDA